jgi:hypothetical protein
MQLDATCICQTSLLFKRDLMKSLNSDPEEVITSHEEPPELSWVLNFRKSRQFTRGWTFQELLAPKLVDFFFKESTRLGDRSSLGQQIHEITVILSRAL